MKHGKMLRRLTALALSAAMAASSAFAVMDPDSRVHLNKTTSVEDMSDVDKTTITLSVGSEETTTGADVVFVLDKSTSTDVKDEALEMLNELKSVSEEKKLSVKVGVVVFDNNVTEKTLDLTELNDNSIALVRDYFNKEVASGTNIEAGIRAGTAMLEDDGDVLPENKHLVLVTDGVSYLWGESGTAKTIYNEFPHHDGSTLIWSSNSLASGVIDKDHFLITQQDYVNSFENPAQWLKDNNEIADVITEYETNWDPDGWKESYNFVSYGSDVVYTANDAALYQAGCAWEDAAEKGYTLYSFVSTDYIQSGSLNTEGYYPWAVNFFANLDEIGGYSTQYDDGASNVDGMFDDVKNSVLYEIQDGTVTDPISKYFDWIGMGTVELRVGGEVLEGETKGNTITYGDAYKVTYDEATRTLTWDINTPVAANAGLKLTYELKIDREAVSEAAASDSDFSLNNIPTNGDTVLKYTSTIDENDKEESFPIPKVTVNEKTPDPDPEPTPDPDPGDGGDEEPYDGPELTIVKVDEEGETITSPATFHIYKEQGDKVLWRMSGGRWSEDEEDAWSYTTRDGETTCYDLKPGTYYIVEISAPEGYDLAEEPLEVEVESRDVTVEFVNSGDGVVTTPTKPVPDTGR